MADIIEWPFCLLRPGNVSPNLVPFTRSGGRSLGGIEPAVRTDLGFWQIDYGGIYMRNRIREQWKAWQAIRQKLAGRAGLIAVRVPSSFSAPYASGAFEPVSTVPHSDDTLFDDETGYEQGAISIKCEGNAPIGSTTIRLRIIQAADDLVGSRFSFNHALYIVGPVIDVTGDIWTVPISPSVRELIPAGADLNFDRPTCLCHLSEDRGMDVSQDSIGRGTAPDVGFTEANDYWNQLALGLV